MFWSKFPQFLKLGFIIILFWNVWVMRTHIIKWFELGQWCEELENPQILNFSVYVICFENNKFMLIVYELRWELHDYALN
jgi:hypothetical protein